MYALLYQFYYLFVYISIYLFIIYADVMIQSYTA